MIINQNIFIDTGLDSVARNSKRLTSLGHHALIITGHNSAKACGALQDVVSILDSHDIAYDIFDAVSANPTVSSCIEAGKLGYTCNADFVIGIGGGSPLDASKAAAVFVSNPTLDENRFYAASWSNRPVPVVLIGTTSGTGSEVTTVSVLTDCTGKKHSLHHDDLMASISLGDPKYTTSLNRDITLSTGIDALTHCIESYFSKKANHISMAYSVYGIRMLVPLLEKVSSDFESLSINDRQGLYDASILGGLAIRVTGTVFPHSLGYYLTENYHVPHGTACSAFTADLLSFASNRCPEYASSFYGSIGISENDFFSFFNKVRPAVNINLTFEEISPIISRWNNNSVKNTYFDISLDDLMKVLVR